MTELEKRIYREIPISAHIGVHVVRASEGFVEVSAPLAPNINHEGTVFGGSLHAVALVACWSVVTLAVEGFDVDYAVVQDSSMDYLKPARGDFHATCSVEATALQQFLETLKRRGRARISLESVVKVNDLICATLRARFVAQTRA